MLFDSIYAIDNRLKLLLDGSVDEETGEIVVNWDEIEALSMERETLREQMACEIVNIRAEIAAIAAQEATLKARREKLKAHEETVERHLYDYSNGANLKSDRVVVSFRASAGKVVIQDDSMFVAWAMENSRDDLLKYAKPTPSKTAIKKAIENGAEIPFAAVDKSPTMSVK